MELLTKVGIPMEKTSEKPNAGTKEAKRGPGKISCDIKKVWEG